MILLKIEDTDMEGKLLLADALIYGQYRHKPSVVVDLATCTRKYILATRKSVGFRRQSPW